MLYHASLSVGKPKYRRHLPKMIYHEIITKNCKKCMRVLDISKMIAMIDSMMFCNIAPHSHISIPLGVIKPRAGLCNSEDFCEKYMFDSCHRVTQYPDLPVIC